MPTLMTSLGIDRLPLNDRFLLIEELWDSIAANPDDVPLTDAQATDLQRRLDAFRDDPKAGSPWEEVRERLRGRS